MRPSNVFKICSSRKYPTILFQKASCRGCHAGYSRRFLWSRPQDVPTLSLLLDSGPDTDICEKAFEELVHRSFARSRAWKYALDEEGLVQCRVQEEIQSLTRKFAYSSEVGFEEAVMQLVDQSSAVLRCKFNPGLPQDPQKILEKCYGRIGAWEQSDLGYIVPPNRVLDVEYVARVFEIQSGDQYLESQGRAVSPVRSIDDVVKQLREEDGYGY